jgi:putative (di)nucleoside polyphosphate hydrolase
MQIWENHLKKSLDKVTQVIDLDGYRANVGIILSNREGKLLWARRIGQDAWQFPQGGIREDEAPEQAMYRELREEIGLEASDVVVLGRTRDWLRYRLPKHLIRRRRRPLCIGQKQVWYLLYLVGEESRVRLDSTEQPEFDQWCWVDFWSPLEGVVSFKRNVYRSALEEFAELLFTDGKFTPTMPAGKDVSLGHGG